VLEILAVDPESIAEELELEPGDRILTVNGRPVRDLVDMEIFGAEEQMLLEIEKASGELWDLEIEKDAGEPLGLHFPHPEPTQCGNNCLFCFVHQLPRGMRGTLYVKDEDYRFSFLYGAYVTLTNIGEEDIARITEQRLSPLYVSVHTTDHQLRQRLLGRSAPSILELLRRLTAAGICIHTQVVLCPGINDGVDLERTVEDLYALFPMVQSLAVVPVGLTGYRQRLPDLRTPTREEAQETLDLIHRYQERFLGKGGSRFVFAADELYLKAGAPFPPLEEYEELAQIENGVGMVSQFRAQGREALCEATPLRVPAVSVFTGESFADELELFSRELAIRTTIRIDVHRIRNQFFGGHVTVAGLLTGRDVVAQLQGKIRTKVLLVPDVVLREGDSVFLDDMPVEEIGRQLGVAVKVFGSTPFGLLEALESLEEE
jgi:putative radical SAM enzyme (TIGR03279 family)